MKNKVINIVFTISLLVSISLSCLLCYAYCNITDDDSFDGGKHDYVHPTFQTEYTEEEHIERLTALVEDIYEEKIKNGDIKSFTVEILHAYYDYDPEYFLIEFDGFGKLGILASTEEKAHLIGFIENDIYTINLSKYSAHWQSTEDGMFKIPQPVNGESPYKQLKLNNRQKYFGGGVYGFFDYTTQKICRLNYDYETKAYVIGNEITAKEQKKLMKESAIRLNRHFKIGRVEFRKQLI